MTHSNEQNKFPEPTSKEIEALDLQDNNFKTTVLNMLKEPRGEMEREQKVISKIIYEQNENINKELEIIFFKKEPTDILELRKQKLT